MKSSLSLDPVTCNSHAQIVYERSDTLVSSPHRSFGACPVASAKLRPTSKLYGKWKVNTRDMSPAKSKRNYIICSLVTASSRPIFSLYIQVHCSCCMSNHGCVVLAQCMSWTRCCQAHPAVNWYCSRINSSYPDIYADNRFPFALLSCVHYEVWSSSASLPGLEPVRLNTVDDDAELLNKPDDCKSCQIYENTHRAFECPSQSWHNKRSLNDLLSAAIILSILKRRRTALRSKKNNWKSSK